MFVSALGGLKCFVRSLREPECFVSALGGVGCSALLFFPHTSSPFQEQCQIVRKEGYIHNFDLCWGQWAAGRRRGRGSFTASHWLAGRKSSLTDYPDLNWTVRRREIKVHEKLITSSLWLSAVLKMICTPRFYFCASGYLSTVNVL